MAAAANLPAFSIDEKPSGDCSGEANQKSLVSRGRKMMAGSSSQKHELGPLMPACALSSCRLDAEAGAADHIAFIESRSSLAVAELEKGPVRFTGSEEGKLAGLRPSCCMPRDKHFSGLILTCWPIYCTQACWLI